MVYREPYILICLAIFYINNPTKELGIIFVLYLMKKKWKSAHKTKLQRH